MIWAGHRWPLGWGLVVELEWVWHPDCGWKGEWERARIAPAAFKEGERER